MKTKFFIHALLVMFAFTACKNDTKKETPETVEVTTGNDVTQATKETPTNTISFNDPKMEAVFNQYIYLKDALVGTNAEKASASAAKLMTSFSNVGASASEIEVVQNVVTAKNIEEQRTAFVMVTTAVETMLAGEIASGTIYKQYCPMAFNNTGASWLSSSSDIMNPYFGDKMLRCGRIEAKIE